MAERKFISTLQPHKHYRDTRRYFFHGKEDTITNINVSGDANKFDNSTLSSTKLEPFYTALFVSQPTVRKPMHQMHTELEIKSIPSRAYIEYYFNGERQREYNTKKLALSIHPNKAKSRVSQLS